MHGSFRGEEASCEIIMDSENGVDDWSYVMHRCDDTILIQIFNKKNENLNFYECLYLELILLFYFKVALRCTLKL